MCIRLRHTLRQFRSRAIEVFPPRFISGLWLLALVLSQAGLIRAAGLKPEELVARHLDSLGTPAARAAVKSREWCKAQHGSRSLSAEGAGWKAKERWFQRNAKFWTSCCSSIPTTRARQIHLGWQQILYRSHKGGPPAHQLRRIREESKRHAAGRVAGGRLVNWLTLLNLDNPDPKLSYGGIKKVDGRQLMVLHYESKKGNDMNIRLYFDPETYQHVMTVYELTASAGLGALSNRPGAEPTQSSRQRDIRYTLEERFSNFITTDGITLPAHYNIHFTEDCRVGVPAFMNGT